MATTKYVVKYGFKIPTDTSKEALRVLKRLDQDGTVIYEADRKQEGCIYEELRQIADDIDLYHISLSGQRLLLMTEGAVEKYTMKAN